MDTRELAAVLTGLRLLQERREKLSGGLCDIFTDGGTYKELDDNEIDELAEKLNSGDHIRPSAKMTLVLTVEYQTEDDSMTCEELALEGASLLEDLVRRASNEGLLSGEGAIVVESYDHRIF